MLTKRHVKLYFEHAEEYGPLLNLKVAQKPTRAGPVPMVCMMVVSDVGIHLMIAVRIPVSPT